jgi:hypothetical protein
MERAFFYLDNNQNLINIKFDPKDNSLLFVFSNNKMPSAETIVIQPQHARSIISDLISKLIRSLANKYITNVAEALATRELVASALKEGIDKWNVPYDKDVDPRVYSEIEEYVKNNFRKEIENQIIIEHSHNIRQELAAEIEGRNNLILSNPKYFVSFRRMGLEVDLQNLLESWGAEETANTPPERENNITADVFIGIPQEHLSLFDIEAIQNATGDVMEAFGYEMESKDEPVYGSFFQRLKYLFRGEVVEAEAGDLYTKGKKALEAQLLNKPTAEVTEKQADAVAKLIVALAPIDEAVLRLGTLMIVKIQRNGIPVIAVETLSPKLAAMMDANPRFLENPRLVFEMLATTKSPTNQLESGASESIEL